MSDLNRLLRQHGLEGVQLVTPNCKPGSLLKLHYFWNFGMFGPDFQLQREMGDIWTVLGINSLPIQEEPTNFILDNVNDSFSISAAASLPQFGLNASGSIEAGVSVTWNITGLKSQIFTEAALTELNTSILPRLQHSGTIPAWVKDCYLVQETFYVTSLSATIKTSAGLSGKAVFEKAGVTTSGGVQLNWVNDDTFTLEGDASVPLAVYGHGL